METPTAYWYIHYFKKEKKTSFVSRTNENSFLTDACLEVEFSGVQ